jgi:hypothetical protein
MRDRRFRSPATGTCASSAMSPCHPGPRSQRLGGGFQTGPIISRFRRRRQKQAARLGRVNRPMARYSFAGKRLAHPSGPSGRHLPPGYASRGSQGSRPSGRRRPHLSSTATAASAPVPWDCTPRCVARIDLPEHCCRRRPSPGGPCRWVRSGQSRSGMDCYYRGASL